MIWGKIQSFACARGILMTFYLVQYVFQQIQPFGKKEFDGRQTTWQTVGFHQGFFLETNNCDVNI